MNQQSRNKVANAFARINELDTPALQEVVDIGKDIPVESFSFEESMGLALAKDRLESIQRAEAEAATNQTEQQSTEALLARMAELEKRLAELEGNV